MQLKIFGPSGTPDEEVLKGLNTLFDVDTEEWSTLANWFLSTESFDDPDDIPPSAFADSSLLPEQFSSCLYALRFILEAWTIHDLQLLDIQRDLFALGYDDKSIDHFSAQLLSRIEPVRERVYSGYMRFEHENAVLPTIENLEVVCDIRPIFEDTVFPPVKQPGVDHRKIVGFTYMVLMELLSEDAEGKTRKLAFQLNEKSLSDLLAAMQRVREQLDILKASTLELLKAK